MSVTEQLRLVAECIGSATEPPGIAGHPTRPGTLADMNGWSDDTERRRLSEPPLPPELSPRRAAAGGGIPPQVGRGPQPGGNAGGGYRPQPGGNAGGGYGPPAPG